MFKGHLLISQKFKVDVGFNFVSLLFLGIAGIIINVLIARFYGAQTLGVFNEVYAVYILASQFAAFSVHLSVQKYLAEGPKKQIANQIISAGILLVLIFSSIVAVIIYFTRQTWGEWFHNQDVAIGVGLISFGLIGFGLNKTLIAVLNGFRAMKAYALFQSLRYVLILGFFIFAIGQKWPAWILPAAFSFAEGVLFIFLFFYCLRYYRLVLNLRGWLKKHFIFGYHALLGNVLVDINTRVDVIILGFFLSAEMVGIYSFAAIIAEGFSLLLVVLKTNVNPILSRLAIENHKEILRNFIRQGIRLTYQYFTIMALAAILLYPLGLKLFLGGQNFAQSWLVFTILLAGLAIAAGYQPFQMLLAQAGYPKYYSLLVTIIFVANVLLNLIFVPLLGIYGSALATGISFIISALVLRLLTKKALKIKI